MGRWTTEAWCWSRAVSLANSLLHSLHTRSQRKGGVWTLVARCSCKAGSSAKPWSQPQQRNSVTGTEERRSQSLQKLYPVDLLYARVAGEVRLVAGRVGVGVMCGAVVGKGSGLRKESIIFSAVQSE
jgi:hypothetical protein